MEEHDQYFFKELLNAINVGIFVLDAKGNYLYVNDCYCRMFNKKPEYFHNTSIPRLKEMGYLTVSVWEQVLQKNAPIVSLVTIRNIELNQVYQHFSTGIPIFNRDGSIKYILYFVESMESMTQRIQEGILNKQHRTETDVITSGPNVDIIVESPKMKQLLTMLNNVSKTDASILITGPTGSGKEVLANYAHRMSMHNDGPFISVDCAAIPENLLESELFGYEKGAFTGAANQGKIGQIELANGGTLFLDEINSMPLGLQGKLLRVLENRKVKKLGALEAKSIDFRLICATNENLESLVQNGGFRSDLFYRINVVPVHVPPLYERKEDIAPLAFFFLQHFCKKYSRMKVLTENVITAMLSYDWPGNVRELKNFIERLVVTSPDTDLQIDTIPKISAEDHFNENKPMFHSLLPEQINLPISREAGFSHRAYMEQCEKQLLQDALKQFKKPTKVAEVLDLDLSNVYRKMRKYHL